MNHTSHRRFLGVGFLTLILAISVLSMMGQVRKIQGNARVINYAGIIRGATQRLVKAELHGIENDEEISQLSAILSELQTGKGEFGLEAIDDFFYQEKLHALANEWNSLTDTIYQARKSSDSRNNLYDVSEDFFVLANDVVSAAESYSEGLAYKLERIEIFTIITVCLLWIILWKQVTAEIQKTRHLSTIAFIDFATGLPNKRSCLKKLDDAPLLSTDRVCCFMFDLNNLKVVNDTMGHRLGDILIASFSDLLRKAAPPSMFVGRFGGDEFISIWESTNSKEIEGFINNLNATVLAFNSSQKPNRPLISFAYGCAFSEDHPHCSRKSLMDIADDRMYKNKAELKSASS